MQVKIQTLEDDKLAEKQHFLQVQGENKDLKLQLDEAKKSTGIVAAAKKFIESAHASITQIANKEIQTLTTKNFELEKLNCAANRQKEISTEEIKKLKKEKDNLESRLNELRIELDRSQSAQRALNAQKVFV